MGFGFRVWGLGPGLHSLASGEGLGFRGFVVCRFLGLYDLELRGFTNSPSTDMEANIAPNNI